MAITNIDSTSPLSTHYAADAAGVAATDARVSAAAIDTVGTRSADNLLTKLFGQREARFEGFGQAGFRAGSYAPHGPGQVHHFAGGASMGPATKATVAGLNLPKITTPPSPRGVDYYTGVGSGAGLKNWLTDVLAAFTTGKANTAAKNVATSKSVLESTIIDESKKVDKAVDADVKNGSILKLNKMSGHQVVKLMNQYAVDNKAVNTASQGVASARAKYDAASARMDAATNRLSANELATAKSDLVSERKKLQANMAARGSALTTAISIATDFVKDPVGAAKKHGWDKAQTAALDIMNETDRARVVELDAKIAVIDKQMKGNLNAATKADFTAARADLVAAKHDLVKANLQLAGAKDNRWRTVDSLAALEKTYPKSGSTTFRAMQKYYASVSHMGKTVHDDAQTFMDSLAAPPFGNANKSSTQMSASDANVHASADVKTYTQRSDADKYTWVSSRAKGIAEYAHKIDTWAKSETAKHADLQTRIEGGEHLGYTGRVFDDIGKRVFGATVHQPHNP